jgi:hypothetical protein
MRRCLEWIGEMWVRLGDAILGRVGAMAEVERWLEGLLGEDEG